MPAAPLPPDTTGRSYRLAHPLAAVLIAAAALLAHLPGLAGTFALDDFGSVVANGTLRRLWPPDWLHPPDEAGVGGRPLANLTFALDHARAGLAPRAYRETNLALHVAAALVLHALLRRLLRPPPGPDAAEGCPDATAAVIAGLWAVHPLTTAAVGYVSQRTELLAALCLLVLLYGFVRYAEDGRRRWAVLAVTASALGMGAKEVMVVAPVLAWLLDRCLLAGSSREAWRRHGRLHLALAGTWLVLAALMATHPPTARGVGFGAGIGPGENLLTQAGAVLLYLRRCLWPEHLVFDHGWAFVRDPRPAVLALATCTLLLGATVAALLRRPAAGFAAAWWWLLLAPTSSVIPILQQPVAESRAYLPLAGVIALAVAGAQQRLRLRAGPVLAAGTLLAVVLGTLSARRLTIFATEVGLWKETLSQVPANPRAHAHLGAALLRAGRPEESLPASREALRLKPDYPDALVNLGVALIRLGRPAEALAPCGEALRLAPDHAGAGYNLGLALAQAGRPAEAAAQFQALLARHPDHAEGGSNLAALLLDLGRPGEAAAQARATLARQPGLAEAHYNLGTALAQTGDPAGAATEFAATLRLRPDHAPALHNLGVLALRAGRPDEAWAHFEAALRLQPDHAGARRGLEAARAAGAAAPR